MKTKPILFSTPMVQAILDGRKTQTRRQIDKDDRTLNDSRMICTGFTDSKAIAHFRFKGDLTSACGYNPKYNIGEILWVRETFCLTQPFGPEDYHFGYKAGGVCPYSSEPASEKYDYSTPDIWKPSIFMPKEACRIFLEVTDVRVERLQDISEGDAIAEGVVWEHPFAKPEDCSELVRQYHWIGSFGSLWQSINGKKSWEANPWVWVYEFKRVEKPENFGQ